MSLKHAFLFSAVPAFGLGMFLVFLALSSPVPAASFIPSISMEQATEPAPVAVAKVTAAAQEKKETATIQFFGDIMLDRNVAKAFGKQGLDYLFEKVFLPGQELFADADLTIANLEGPFAAARIKTSKSIAFRFDPALADQLQRYGFDAVSLANNHTYDMGTKNVPFTREVLAKAGIGYFGDELKDGSDYTWFSSTSPRVALIGVHATYRSPDRKKLAAAIADARAKADIVIAFPHWGEEYQRISNKKQRELAHWLVDQGVSVVIGAHPHVVQEAEIYNGAPIFYSLGNFIFDQYFSKDTQEGLSVVLSVAERKVTEIKLIPFFGAKSQVEAMTAERREQFLEWMTKNSRLDGKKFADGILSL